METCGVVRSQTLHMDMQMLVVPSGAGDGRARTGDPLLAKQMLFQLSYAPVAEEYTSFGVPERHRSVSRLVPRMRLAWAFLDSNQRPHGYQPCALTN